MAEITLTELLAGKNNFEIFNEKIYLI